MTDDFVVVGPPMRVPGSDQFMLNLGILLLLVGIAWLLVAAIVRWARSRRAARAGGTGAAAPAADPAVGFVVEAGTPGGAVPPRRRRPAGLVAGSVVALVGLVLSVANRPYPFFVPEFPALPRLLPEQAVFYRSSADLPVAADSDRWIGALRGTDGEPLPLVHGFRGSVSDGVVFGIPFNPVDDATARYQVGITSDRDRSPRGPYPISDPAYIQSMPAYGIDNHYVGVDPESGTVWELLSARRWFGRWEAYSGARWRMDDLGYPEGWTIAAGLPLLPGVITYDEIADGRVDHVVLAGSPVVGTGEPLWPARATDGRSPDPDAPPMGAWLRLRADVDISDLPPQARAVAEGLKRYGLLISDTSGNFQIRGTPDRRWDDSQLERLGELTAADFEVVDASAVIVSPDSMEARAAPPG